MRQFTRKTARIMVIQFYQIPISITITIIRSIFAGGFLGFRIRFTGCGSRMLIGVDPLLDNAFKKVRKGMEAPKCLKKSNKNNL
jgi:putative component of membrane protein insertase Oxa1/YidC/SpoIIIJ protein YidD